MKFVKVILFLLITASSYGQYQSISVPTYWHGASGFDNVFIGNDTIAQTDKTKRWVAIKNAVLYFHDGTKWTAISSGGSGGSFTLPQADSNTLGGIRYNTDLALDLNNRLGIAPGKKALWNTIANLPLFYATGDSTRLMMHDTAVAHDYVIGDNLTLTGRRLDVVLPPTATDSYTSSIWYNLLDKPAVWDAKTDYSEFLDSVNSLRAIRRDSVFFDRRYFAGNSTSSSPITLVNVPDYSTTESGLIKPGYVTWSGTGYTYDVTPAIYRVNGLYYTSAAGSVTLDAADGALNRIDAVVVDTFGVVSKITGVAASNPVAPIPNPSSQVLLTNITVTPGSSAPSTVNTIVYNEEGNGEYTGSSSGVTSNTANTTFPFSGAKSDNIGAWTSNSTVTFTNGTTASATSYTYLKFFIRLKGIVQNATSISVIFYNGTTPVSKLVSIVNYGINKSLVGSYQNVSVPFSVFGFTSNQFNKIQIRFGGPDGPGCYLDFIQLQNSAVTETGSNALTDVYIQNGNLYKTVGGNSVLVGAVGGSGGAATDTTSLSSRINAKLNISDAATTYFPLTGGTLTGTGGNGYVGFNPQSATPSTPTSGFRLFATNPGAFAWITSQGYARELRVRAQTQNNIYYLQDKSYTLADSSDVAAKLNIIDTANIRLRPVAGTNMTITGTYPNLTFNSTASGGGTGTVTGGSITWPSTIYSSPTTGTVTSGSLSFSPTLNTQSANSFFAGPTTGSAANPTFRALVAADFPALTVPIGSINATGTPSATTYLRGDGSWGTPAAGSTGWSLSGNSINPATDFIGTTSNNSFRIRTNNVQRVMVDSLGFVGIGGNSNNGFALNVTGSINGTNNIQVTGNVVANGGSVISVGQIQARAGISVNTNSSTINALAVAEFASTTKGMLVPRMAAPPSSQAVTAINVTNGGSGYTTAPTVTISGGAASATAVISGGAVTSVTLNYANSTSGSAPTVTFSGGGGTGAAATAVIGTTEGLYYYCTTHHGIEVYNGTNWILLQGITVH